MLESGVPVVNAYMADLHGNNVSSLAACQGAPAALGSGSACYIAQAQYYNAAFGTFFKRLAADGITPANTLFVLSADEGDHEAGANVGRAVTPTPAGCDGATVSGDTVTPDVLCTYPSGSFGELAGNLTGLLATQKNNITPFTVEADTAPEFYLTGNPGPTNPVVRQFEHDVAGLTAANPYTGDDANDRQLHRGPGGGEHPALHERRPGQDTHVRAVRQAGLLPVQQARRPAPRPAASRRTRGFAWDHGDYAAEINMTYLGLVGPGVKHLGIDGWGPAQGPNSAGPNSGQTVSPTWPTPGTWADHTDIEPTELYLTGLQGRLHPGRHSDHRRR